MPQNHRFIGETQENISLKALTNHPPQFGKMNKNQNPLLRICY